MIGVLLLSSSFLMLVLIAILVLAFNIKTWAQKREQINQQRFDELTKRIDETQRLFRTDVSGILKQVNKILND